MTKKMMFFTMAIMMTLVFCLAGIVSADHQIH